MYEEHRKYTCCIFCETEGLTREHIFGKSLAAKLAIQVPWRAVSHSTNAEHDGLPLKGSSPITHIAPRLLCDTCNTKRLSELMNTSLPILLALIRGECGGLSATDASVVLRYFERIALIVDVVTSDHEMSEKHLASTEFIRTDTNRVTGPVISQEARSNWLHGASPPDVSVFIGNHEGVMGLNPDMCITHLRFRDSPRGEILGNVKRVSIVIGKLAVCIDLKMPSDGIPGSFVALRSVDFAWPPPNEASYEDYLSLRYQDAEVRQFLAALSQSEKRVEIERVSREVGYLKIPVWSF
jgi:hypothetical protein